MLGASHSLPANQIESSLGDSREREGRSIMHSVILSTLPLIGQFVFENACIIAEYMADNLRLNTWESYMKEAILMKESNRVFIL